MLVAAAIIVGQFQVQKSNYMTPAQYPVGSLKKDPTEPGGHSESNNMPVPLVKKPLAAQLPAANLTKTKNGVSVSLLNPTPNEIWLGAADGNLFGWLEAFDGKDWKPIEYHMWYSCGNSYHRVVLPPSYAWKFEKEMPKGDWKTQVRFTFMFDSKTISSEPIKMNLPKSKLELTPDLAKEYRVSGPNPTLLPSTINRCQ